MATADEPPRLTALQALLLLVLFAGLTLLFVRLLRPLATPASASATPVAAGPAVVPAPRAEPEAIPEATAETPLPAAPEPPADAEPDEVAAAPPPPPFAPDFKGPRVAIVLTDVGDDPARTRAAIAALPAEIGLAFTPYADARALVRAARADGHEVIAGLPMQPKAWPRVSPGAHTLLVDAAPAENLQRLDWALSRVEGATAVTGIMGSAFTERASALKPVIGALGDRGLAYLDARASAKSVGVATARAAHVRAAANDRFLDESGDVAANLAALAAQAKRQGSAIGYARPLPATIAAIESWAAALDDRGVLLVPPSSLAR